MRSLHSLFQAKFQNAPRDGPAKESGDQNRGDRRDRHDKKDPALNILHVRDGARQLFIELAVNALDVGRSRILNSFQFVCQDEANNFPVAGPSQGRDVIELKRQSDLNRVQSGQKCRIYTEFRRQVSKRAPCLLCLLLQSRT